MSDAEADKKFFRLGIDGFKSNAEISLQGFQSPEPSYLYELDVFSEGIPK
jgi:hypothetical protein